MYLKIGTKPDILQLGFELYISLYEQGRKYLQTRELL